jgi:hypothetical protein
LNRNTSTPGESLEGCDDDILSTSFLVIIDETRDGDRKTTTFRAVAGRVAQETQGWSEPPG